MVEKCTEEVFGGRGGGGRGKKIKEANILEVCLMIQEKFVEVETSFLGLKTDVSRG
jgi:hypothetical protein